MTLKLALIGNEISYTASPRIHKAIAETLGYELTFDVLDVPVGGLEVAAADAFGKYDGLFVTKPYKLTIKSLLCAAHTDGGINLVKCKSREGYNTDGAGFIRALDKELCGWRDDVKSAVVLGAGGAAYSVVEALIGAGKKVFVLNRTLMHAAKLCSALGAELYVNQPCELIVNCTSLGLNGEDALKSLCVMPEFDYAFDLVYGVRTKFLDRCAAAGGRTADGTAMLVYQAIEGVKIVTGMEIDTDGAYDDVIKRSESIGENK